MYYAGYTAVYHIQLAHTHIRMHSYTHMYGYCTHAHSLFHTHYSTRSYTGIHSLQDTISQVYNVEYEDAQG